MSGPDDSETPTLDEFVEVVVKDVLDGQVHSLPGRVESVDLVHQTVNVQPWIRRWKYNPDGSTGHERLPVAVSAPVMFPRAAGSGLTFPIPTGSTVYLEFPSISIEQWLLNGREVNAGDPRRHSMSDVVAWPTGHAFAGPAKPSTAWPQDAVVLWAATGLLLKLVSDQADEIVAINSELAALTDTVNEIRVAFLAHGHIPPTGGITSKPTTASFPGTPPVPISIDAAADPDGSPRVRVPAAGAPVIS